jgi:hypothetical protein
VYLARMAENEEVRMMNEERARGSSSLTARGTSSHEASARPILISGGQGTGTPYLSDFSPVREITKRTQFIEKLQLHLNQREMQLYRAILTQKTNPICGKKTTGSSRLCVRFYLLLWLKPKSN